VQEVAPVVDAFELEGRGAHRGAVAGHIELFKESDFLHAGLDDVTDRVELVVETGAPLVLIEIVYGDAALLGVLASIEIVEVLAFVRAEGASGRIDHDIGEGCVAELLLVGGCDLVGDHRFCRAERARAFVGFQVGNGG
jgi:hypothetical protein